MAEFNTTADTLCNEEPHSLPQEAKPDIDAIEPCVGSAPGPTAGEAGTRRRRAAGSAALADEVFAHILGFWHWRT